MLPSCKEWSWSQFLVLSLNLTGIENGRTWENMSSFETRKKEKAVLIHRSTLVRIAIATSNDTDWVGEEFNWGEKFNWGEQ